MMAEQKLVDEVLLAHKSPERSTEELVALGLLELDKWDRIYDRSEKCGGKINADDILAIDESLTDRNILSYKDTARRILDEYHSSRRHYSWWSGVLQSTT